MEVPTIEPLGMCVRPVVCGGGGIRIPIVDYLITYLRCWALLLVIKETLFLQ